MSGLNEPSIERSFIQIQMQLHLDLCQHELKPVKIVEWGPPFLHDQLPSPGAGLPLGLHIWEDIKQMRVKSTLQASLTNWLNDFIRKNDNNWVTFLSQNKEQKKWLFE